MTLEKKLVRLRKKEGMSQADVSEKLNVSRQAVSRWEAGDSRPSIENLQALCKLYMAIVFCVPAFAVDTATTEQTEPVVFKSNTLPDWFPEDAPAPDPHGEIVTVYWYVDENGNTVTYNPAERKTATGNAGTATIYWVDAHMVTWGITSNAGGAMVFTGTVSTNRGQIFVLGDIEFDGDCGGTIDNVTTLKGKNTATLSGFMIDSRGISITAPDVSSNYYR